MSGYDNEPKMALIQKRARDYQRILNAIEICENLEKITVTAYEKAAASEKAAAWSTLRDNGLVFEEGNSEYIPGKWTRTDAIRPWIAIAGRVIYKSKDGKLASDKQLQVLKSVLGTSYVEDMDFEPLPGYYRYTPGRSVVTYYLDEENVATMRHIANAFIALANEQ